MAYGKYSRGARTTRSRRAYSSRASTSTYRKVAKPPRQAIPALARQVATLKRQVRPLTQNKLYYQRTGNVNIGNLLGDNCYILNLTNPGDWNRLWGTDADDEQSHTFTQNKLSFKYQMIFNGERARVQYTCCVVTLTKIGATELYNVGTGSLNALVLNTHYSQALGFPGMGVFLNKRYFNIHYYRTFVSESATNDSPMLNINPKSFTYNKPVTYTNPGTGDWRTGGRQRNATANMYFLVFNSDNSADADVAMQFNALIQGTAV
jgi:hypothetical protein